jgi:hypothetical protein
LKQKLLITIRNLLKLLKDLKGPDGMFLHGCCLNLDYVGHNKEENTDYFEVWLDKGQVKTLDKVIPRQTILERYESR